MPPVGPRAAVHVRRATPADVGFLTDVVVVATRAQGRLPADFDERAYRDGFADWTQAELDGSGADAERSETSVIEIDGARAGRWRVRRGADHVELCGVQLLPPHQGDGIGTHLVEQLLVATHADGLPVRLAVEKDNPRARSFYERLGFHLVDETDTDDLLESPAPTTPRID